MITVVSDARRLALDQDIEELDVDSREPPQCSYKGKRQLLPYEFNGETYVVESVFGHPPTRVIGRVGGKKGKAPLEENGRFVQLGLEKKSSRHCAYVLPVDSDTEGIILRQFTKD